MAGLMDMRQTVQAEAGVADPFQGRADRKVDVLRARWLETTASFHTLPCTRNEGAFRGSAQLLLMDAMLSPQESIGVQSLAIRMAYRLCEPEPELLYELRTILESTETEMYSTAVKSAVRNTLKKINQKNKKKK